LELRIFGARNETLIWRTGQAFAGRKLRDSNDELDLWARPMEETWIVLGDRLVEAADNGFAVIGDARGSRQCVPFQCVADDFIKGKRKGVSPFRLTVRHYIERDDIDGSVRTAASRLVNLFKECR
jgi:CRISPR-associated protein (TIGR03984 family)